jgi:hypothetical protein
MTIMRDTVGIQATSTMTVAVGRTLQTRLTRRALLRTVGRMSAGAIAFGLAGGARTVQASPQAPTRPATSHDAAVATAWFRLALQLVMETPGISPPVAARAFGYLGVTLYEALVPGLPGHQSLAGQLNGLAPIRQRGDHGCHWPLVANGALAAITRQLFPTVSLANQAAIDALELAGEMANVGVPDGIARRSLERGRAVAAHIASWSTTDGGHNGHLTNFPTHYTPPVGPGLWVPTPPAFQRALQPFWGLNRPFVLSSGGDVDPGPPPPFSTDRGSAFHAEASEVYQTVNSLNAEQRAIARFWADDPGQTATPPGHCLSILTQLIEDRHLSLAVASEAYAKAGIAVADAFVSCWAAKFRYNLLRPISFVQQQIDAGWDGPGAPLPVTTPPFPEYPSGHSVQTAAFAQVLFHLFGDFPFTDHTHDARGLSPRSFTTCSAMAEEAAISRLYGGIHYRAAIERGITQGTEIGRRVNRLTMRA